MNRWMRKGITWGLCAAVTLAGALPAYAVYPNGASGGDGQLIAGGDGFFPESRQLDYDFLLSVIDEYLPAILPTWSTTLFSTVTSQTNAKFYGFDNNGNGIKDHDHLDALAAVVNGGTTAATGVNSTDIATLQAAFAQNRAAVQKRELVFPRVTVTAFGFITVQLNNVATGYTQSVAGQNIALPSLWTSREVVTTANASEQGLLAEASPMLEIFLRDWIAGEMTLAGGASSTEAVHLRSFMSVFLTAFLRTQLATLLSGIGTITFNAGNNFNTLDIDVNAQSGADTYRVRIAGANQGSQHTQQAIAFFSDSFSPTPAVRTWTGAGYGSGAPPAPDAWHDGVAGGSQWPSPAFTCPSGAGTLEDTGDLNRNSTTNAASYTAASQNRQNWMQAEGITVKPLQFSPVIDNVNSFTGAVFTVGDDEYTILGGSGAKSYDWASLGTLGSPLFVTSYEYSNPVLGGTTTNATYVFNPTTAGDNGRKMSVQVVDGLWTRTLPKFTVTLAGLPPAPTVSSISVTGNQTIVLTYSSAVAAGATTATNYTLTGGGRGTFNSNPDSVTSLGGNQYQLTWNAPQEMLNGGSLNVAVSGVQDSNGQNVGTPNNASCTSCAIGTAPTISSIVSQDAGPTNAATINYTVTFSEGVNVPASGNFTVTTTGTAAGTVGTISGSGSSRTVPITGITGTGTVRLDLSTATGITDLAGNALVTTLNGGVSNVDRDAPGAPTVDLSASSDSGPSNSDDYTNDNTPTLTGNAEAGSTVNLTSSVSGAIGAAVTNGSGVWTITTAALPNATHSITATATDAVGNVSTTSTPLLVTIDTVAPAAPSIPDLQAASDTGSSNSDNITNLTTLTFEGTREASTSITMTTSQSGSFTTAALGSGTWTVTGSSLTANQIHNVRARAFDLAGNQSADSSPLAVTVDTNAPTVSVRNPASGATVGSLPNVQVTFNESVVNVAGANLTVDGSAATAVSGSGTGAYNFTGYAAPADNPTLPVALAAGSITDVAGNAFAGNAWTYNKNTSAPTITWTPTGVTDGGITNGSPAVQMTVTFSEGVTGFVATDITRVNCTISGFTAVNATTYTFNVNLSAQGTVSLSVNAGQATAIALPAGRTNLASPLFSFTYDSIGPSVTSIFPITSDPTNADTIEYSVNFNGPVVDFDDFGDVTYIPDGTLAYTGLNIVQNTTSNYTVEFTGVTGDGIFTPFVNAGAAKDAANNNSGAGIGIGITVDNTAPVVTVDSLTTTDNTPELTGTVDEADAPVSVTVNGQLNNATVVGNVWTLDDNTLLPVPDGVFDVLAESSDIAGNIGADTTTDELTVDATPPVLTLSGLLFESVDCGDGFTDGFTAIDTVDGNLTANVIVSDVVPFDALPGQYVINYEVSDSAGNTSTATRTVEVLDNCPLDAFAVSPTSFVKDGGESVTLEIGVSGNIGAYSIQWYRVAGSKADQPIGDGQLTLTLSNLDQFDDAIYYAEVTDSVTSVQSPNFTVVVNVTLPVAGAAGLAILSVLSALGGAFTLRRRK